MKTSELLILFCVIISLFVSTLLFAGYIEPQVTPPDTSMYTVTDIYNLIHENNNTPGNHTLSTTTTPIATSSYSVSQLYADLANLIKRENLETGVKYLGVTGDLNNADPAYSTTTVIASSLTPSGTAGDSTGYSLEDIWNLIDQNATTTPGTHANVPSTGPASSVHSLADIYNELNTLANNKKTSVKSGEAYLGQGGSYIFTGPYGVTFSTADANGSLSASVNSLQINSGDTVEASSSIIFTATLNDGYFVDEWSVNGSVQEGQTNNEFIIADLQANTEVTVSFVDYSTWLLLDMPFEDGSDASFTPDISGNDNNGTVTGATWSDVSGHNNTGGYYFNGQYITIATSSNSTLKNLSQMSVEAWVNPSFLWGGGTGNRIACVYPWGWASGRWCLYFYSGNTLHWSVMNIAGSGTEGVYSNGSTFTLDQWYHVVGTYNGASVKVYVNGNPGATVGSLTGNIYSANFPTRIGYDGGDYYKGYIDGVKIYNKGLTAEQVNILYNR